MLPLLPPGLAGVLLDHEVSRAEEPRDGGLESPGDEPGPPQDGREGEPCHGGQDAGGGPHGDLPGGVVAEVHPAPGDGGGQRDGGDGDEGPLGQAPGAAVVKGGTTRPPGREGGGRGAVADEKEEDDARGPEGDELGVAAGHAVALPVDARGAALLEDALEAEVEGLAEELAAADEDDLGLARGEYQGRVDDAEGLGDEGEVGAQVRDVVFGVLWGNVSFFFFVLVYKIGGVGEVSGLRT